MGLVLGDITELMENLSKLIIGEEGLDLQDVLDDDLVQLVSEGAYEKSRQAILANEESSAVYYYSNLFEHIIPSMMIKRGRNLSPESQAVVNAKKPLPRTNQRVLETVTPAFTSRDLPIEGPSVLVDCSEQELIDIELPDLI